MPLVLRIENVDTLPDGGPVFVEIDRRGIDIGRDTFLDWTLPDPERFISGKHCEIHFRDGGYWLHDVSTNGTSINGQPGRLTEPHRLQHGDRIHIGPYIVQTELSGVEAGPGGPGPVPDKGGTSVGGDPWGDVGDTAEAIDRRDFTARSQSAGRNGPADLAEENISWGFGDVAPKSDAGASASDWGAPPAPKADADSAGAEWGAPPSTPPGAPDSSGDDWGAPSAARSTPDPAGADWGAPPEPERTPDPAGDEWGAPSAAASSPAPASSAGDGLDWGAPPASDSGSGGGSPWDFSPGAASGGGSSAGTPEPVKPVSEPAHAPESPASAEAESVGDNPFLHSSDTPAPEPDEVKEADPEVAKAAEEGAFGALSEQSSPTSAPPPEPEQSVESAAEPEPEPQPSSSLSDQWAGGEEKTPEPAPLAATAPAETVAAAPTTSGDGSFVASFERGAGLPAGSISGRTDDALAEELGQLFNKVTQALQAMLLARAETKSAMRSSERTMISALENNPLKFSPTPEDALRIMFGQKSKSYLDAGQTIDQSFSDLQKHQMQTFGAMQSALQVLIEDLDPETIAGATAKDGGLAALVSSRRAKFWDTYVERFKAKSAHHDRGMIDAFMILFAEMYDRQS